MTNFKQQNETLLQIFLKSRIYVLFVVNNTGAKMNIKKGDIDVHYLWPCLKTIYGDYCFYFSTITIFDKKVR